jgi:hypothetical protein
LETPTYTINFCYSPTNAQVISFQPDALFIQIYCYKTLHVSGIFSAHNQEFSTVNSAVVSFMQVLMTASKQSQDGTEPYQCRMYSGKLLMMGKEDARNM